MNLLKTILLIPVSFSFLFGIQAQTRLSLLEGGLVYSKNTLITFKGLDFYNEGAYLQDSSTLLIRSGELGQDVSLAGEGDYSLYNLQLDMGPKALVLGNDLKIEKLLLLSEGDLDLNGQTLTLGREEARIIGEGNGKHILGEGVIEKQVDLNYPQHLTPGNLGIEITAEGNLGQTVLRRIQQMDDSDSLSLIHRQYEFETSFLPSSPIHLSLNYFQSDNPFGNDARLKPVEEQLNTWSEMSYFQSSQKENSVDVWLTESKKSWHIGLSPDTKNNALGEEKTGLDFHLYPNPFDGFLYLQWAEQGEIPVEFRLYNATGVNVHKQTLTFQSQEILLEGIPDLPAGMYIVKILTDKGNTGSRSLVHKK